MEFKKLARIDEVETAMPTGGNGQPMTVPGILETEAWRVVALGSTDGRKIIASRIPESPIELINIVYPASTSKELFYDVDQLNPATDGGSTSFASMVHEHWSNKMQFVLACVGYSVGLGSIWRFPYLCYKSGGGVFLIAYAIITLICGIPMLYMELAIGQFTGRGPIGALKYLCPLLKGTGLASVVISFLMSTYYSVIIAYTIYYFFTAFKPKHSWEDCNQRWNTNNCWMPTLNISKPIDSRTPAEEFFDHKVLQISKGIDDDLQMRWELVACLIAAWIIIYFSIWKSIKSSAVARYYTSLLPFALILVFLGKSLTLHGAESGIRYFFEPRIEGLLDAKVWINAVTQTFNSMGIAFGSIINFASYNKFNNNILYDTLAVSFVNSITSLLVGMFAFATIGNIATELHTSVEDVLSDGPGLVFILFSQAMSKMPAAHIWAVLFFFMLTCLALNSQFAIVEVVVTSIQDGFPVWMKKKKICHELLVLIVCVVSFVCGLPNVTKSGIYFFQLIDHYTASISIMYLAFFEVIAIAWIYGAGRLCRNVKTMVGSPPGLYFKICWYIATPVTILAIWIFYLIGYESPTYNKGQYIYPLGAIILGWIISSISLLCIPICMVYVIANSSGSNLFEKIKQSFKSKLIDKCPQCDDYDCMCIFKVEETGEVEPMLIITSRKLSQTNVSHNSSLSKITASHTADMRKKATTPSNSSLDEVNKKGQNSFTKTNTNAQ